MAKKKSSKRANNKRIPQKKNKDFDKSVEKDMESKVKDFNNKKEDSKEQEENVRYRLRPIFLQVIGMSMMFIGAIMIFVPMITGLFEDERIDLDIVTKIEEIDNSKRIDTGEVKDGISTNRVQAATLSAKAKSDLNIASIRETGVWMATNYEFGDIGYGKYEVRLGDTLWEISEAVYGDGTQWYKILEQNSDQIGFLPNGEQALMYPGQVLVIPR